MKTDPQENLRALHRIASQQAGYFTAAQARDAGYGYRQHHFHTRRGNWLKLDWGLYRLRDYPDSPHEDLVRWALWSRNRAGIIQAVVSHDTALALHQLGDLMPGKIHLTVPGGFRKGFPGGCVIHRGRIPETEIEKREGFIVTSPLRTIADCAKSDLSPEHLGAAVRDALRRGLTRKDQLTDLKLPCQAKKRLDQALDAAQDEPV